MARDSLPARAGLGLRARHHLRVLSESVGVAWLEAHTENYIADGGAHVEVLARIRARYPLSLHGVGLSLGSADPLDTRHLERVRRAVKRFEPVLLSEHLSGVFIDGALANGLLSLAYTEEALRHQSARIAQAQDFLGGRILIDIVSSYLQSACSRMPVWEFLAGG